MHKIRSADHALMREMNLALLLECLRREAPLSRADLALITGLTKADAWAQTRARGQTILGLGLGLPGLVDVSTGTLLFSPNLGWTGLPLRRLLEAKFPFPIYIDNEANLAALGESYFGAARGCDFVL